MLKNCVCGGEAVEQRRGKMGPGDYFGLPEAHHETVECPDNQKDDIRIICRKCRKTHGWNVAHAPGAPGAIADYMRKKWNDEIDNCPVAKKG